LSQPASKRSRNGSLRKASSSAPTPPAMASVSSHHQLRRKPLIAIIACVRIGSARFELVNTVATCGTT
jgi:hypothetical protein